MAMTTTMLMMVMLVAILQYSVDCGYYHLNDDSMLTIMMVMMPILMMQMVATRMSMAMGKKLDHMSVMVALLMTMRTMMMMAIMM